eukprot:CAMPEP_0118935664 /NCGR_PEP_ID=MMETSP1169-20130426/15766_1 /TAXON_ID=36882 /ORGANISM="Pyramimonas obovata, Strain CCMP722" /LENGTH=209 /DNA_ID=CAMNT_0006878723 /DNA_START=574 /DNA_END=1203 /DNA_ORIENTATION=+
MSASKELSYNGQGIEGPCFNGSTVEELRSFLERFGLDTSGYGSGKAKTVDGLMVEVEKGETVIKILDDRPVRQVQVVCLFLRNDFGQILVEAKQVLPDGRERQRNRPLSEKLMRDEPWDEEAIRGVKEELGSCMGSNATLIIDKHSHRIKVEWLESTSYPGLLTIYNLHRVDARLTGIPMSGSFMTTEETGRGIMENHWEWRDEKDVLI